MTGDRERMAPEMTPMVSPMVDPAAKTQPAEGGREEVEDHPTPAPGQVPGPGTNVEGASRGGTTNDQLEEARKD